jgi:ribosome biogenesis GTPase
MAYKEGLVIKKYSGFYYVQDEEMQVFECKLRGKLKKAVLTGDRVKFTALEEHRGVLESILPRNNALDRPLVANVTTVLIVMANNKPSPNLPLLDRLLFLASYKGLSPIIILNKCDLEDDEKSLMIKGYYHRAGFKLIQTSAKMKIGLDILRQAIKGQIAVFTGPSGSGKSSLLNALIEGLNIRTQEVSKKIGRGKHTTRHVELFPLQNGAWLVDTPGFSVLDIPTAVKSRDLAEHFWEFKTYNNNCRFNNCLHYKEKDCGVKEAVAEGLIADFRYQSYLSMLEEVIENERCYK